MTHDEVIDYTVGITREQKEYIKEAVQSVEDGGNEVVGLSIEGREGESPEVVIKVK